MYTPLTSFKFSGCRVASDEELFDHPPYISYLASSDFHLFPHMNTWFTVQRFNNDEELHTSVCVCLKSEVATFYNDGINKLMYQYDKCLNLDGGYVEK